MTTADNDQIPDIIEFRQDQHRRTIATRIPAMFLEPIDPIPGLADWGRRYLANPEACGSLMISGPTGTGKTHQIYQAIRIIGGVLADRGQPFQWLAISHPELNATQRGGDGRTPASIQPYLNIDMLFLDDIGAGKQSDWTGDVLYRIVDHRWSNRKPTIYATNLSPVPLGAALGDRTTSRLASADVIVLKGDDRRWLGGAA